MLKVIRITYIALLIIFLTSMPGFAADGKVSGKSSLSKTLGHEHRKRGIHDGNNILTVFFNYGCIGNWFEDSERLEAGIFPKGSGHSYFAEFTPFIGAEVTDRMGHKRRIISDGVGDVAYGADMAPGDEYQYCFEPITGYSDDNQDYVAMYNALGSEDADGPDRVPSHMGSEDDDGKPDSWPWIWPDRPEWVNKFTGVPFWNGQYGAYNRADQESYFRMNDDANDEFQFYPDPTDSSRRGLALEVEVRGYQWADPAAEDIIIFTYWVNNMGKTLYSKTLFGMYGDADVGEQIDNKDDLSEFNKEQDIVFQWDSDLYSGSDGGFVPAFFGWKFLESPGDPRNERDDDGDGLPGIDGNPWDESQEDGIDNDGDWDHKIDDIGSDGKGPDHPDYVGPDPDGTEGNGVPDRGEPNFEYTDNDESDQIGLTSFFSGAWSTSSGGGMQDDNGLWLYHVPGTFAKAVNLVDIIMHYGSGYFELPPRPEDSSEPGDSRRKFAISMVMGVDRDDLIRNALTMQQIYNHDYNFAAVPLKPRVTAVPGDRRVLLYWDKTAERSRDPIYGRDFEGYLIYRATDPSFLESYIGTDTYGNPSFNKPIAQFDLVDSLYGPHPIGRDGIQFNMGNDTGLHYSFIDSGQTWMGPVENGQTYYYAVCSYDKGYDVDFYVRGISEMDSLQAKAPAICTKKIQFNASGQVTFLDINTVLVIPNAPASGYIKPPELNTYNESVKRIEGAGTGLINVLPIDPSKITDGAQYEITFDDSSHMNEITKTIDTTFTVKDTRYYTETVRIDTNAILLQRHPIVPSSVTVKLKDDGREYVRDIDYIIGWDEGTFIALEGGSMPISSATETYYAEISYQYYPIKDSPYIRGEDQNEFFDGLQVVVNTDKLEPDNAGSHWLHGEELHHYLVKYGFIGENDPIPERNLVPSNYEFIINKYANQGIIVPYDFHIVFYDSIVTKSSNNKLTNMRVFNITTGDTANFVFFNTNDDSTISDQDVITPVKLVNNRARGTWQVKFWAPKDIIAMRDSLDQYGFPVLDKEGTPIKINLDTTFVEKVAPKPGDIFHIAIRKPFSSIDKYQFTAKAPSVDYKLAHADESLNRIAVVPNPYIVTASWEPQHFYSSGRGTRKIDFIHLPPKCTIKIFTMRGFLVDTIEHDSPITDGAESWDMLSKDGMEIAYGVYLFHVETPDGKSHVGKFAVIK